MWILIIILTTPTGVSIDHIEFSSKENCQAVNDVLQTTVTPAKEFNLATACVEK